MENEKKYKNNEFSDDEDSFKDNKINNYNQDNP